jgi:hypothetical protein
LILHLHTDIGHDPDDAVALAYLLEKGYNPDYISITPGYHEQSAIVRTILLAYGRQPYPTLFKVSEPTKLYESGKHKVLIGSSEHMEPMANLSSTDLIVLGPPKGLGNKAKSERLWFQGGYSPNSIKPLDKFSGRTSVQSFNPSGAREDFKKIVASDIKKKHFIGKNVCHGFTKQDMIRVWRPKSRIMQMFLDKLDDDKAMHDVLACMIFTGDIEPVWEQAKPQFCGLELTTVPTDEDCYTLIGIN